MGNFDLDNDELLAFVRINIENRELEPALIKLKTIVGSGDAPAEAYLIAARLYASLGLFSKSQEHYKLYNSAEPQNTIGRFELGMTLFDSNDNTGALEHWKLILDDNPTHPPALFYIALAQAKLGDIATAQSHLDILMKSVVADNAYFQKGRELAASLASQQGVGKTMDKPIAIDAYSEDNGSEDSTALSEDKVTH
jgi:tetratricopeptide (TPR) repeat protein